MKKTAINQMITYMEENFHLDDEALNKFKDLLVEEREQIYEAFVAGDNRGNVDIPFNCEQYYSQTYKN